MCVGTYTHTLAQLIHTVDIWEAGTVQTVDSCMTLCGPLAVCKGGEVSGQTTVVVSRAKKRANSEVTVYKKKHCFLVRDLLRMIYKLQLI